MPRAKKPSDELHNARRRAQRLAARLEQAGNAQGAQGLRDIISASYGKGATIGVQELTTASNILRVPATSAPVRTPGQSRPKRASDELYNARRRLRRQAAKLEREAAQETDATRKKLAQGFADYLRKEAEVTKKKQTAQEQQATLDRLNRIREATRSGTYDRFKVRRRNMIITQQLNAAGTEGAESSISERKKDVFWASTKGLWPSGSNVPRNERYDRILAHFYSDQTSDAKEFRAWLEAEKGVSPSDAFGDLTYVFEYLTEVLNDPSMYDLPDLPYAMAMQMVITAM